MNERIRELAVECTFFTYGVNGELLYDGFNKEKFAELIVRECIAKYDEWAEESSDQTSFRMARHNVRKHFGVE
jgi:hypothetical protein